MATPPLISVEAYVTDVRAMILDTVRPFRYLDAEVVHALNMTLLEARRLRPDLFVTRWGSDVPYFNEVSTAEVPIEAQFRLAFVYGVTAHVLMRDDEDVQDSRVNTFYGRFHDMLTGVRPRQFPIRPPQGGQAPPSAEQ